jgi:hypothetical protein
LRERASAFAALLAHAAVLAALAMRELPPPRPVDATIDAIEIIDSSDPPVPPAPTATSATETPGPGVSHVVASRAESKSSPDLEPHPASVGNGEATTTIAIGPAPGGSAAPIALGIGGTRELNPFLPKHDEPAPTTADDGKAAERSVKDALHARDREIGLTPEGPVLSALRDATYDSAAPPKGRAVFVAIVDKLGVVVDLRLGDGEAATWREVRERAVKTLASRKVTMRGAGPVELRIEVVSQVTLPSGSEHHVSPAMSASKIEVPDSAKIGGGAADVVQSWTVGTFDLSDVGAKRRQVVHARVVSSHAL